MSAPTTSTSASHEETYGKYNASQLRQAAKDMDIRLGKYIVTRDSLKSQSKYGPISAEVTREIGRQEIKIQWAQDQIKMFLALAEKKDMETENMDMADEDRRSRLVRIIAAATVATVAASAVTPVVTKNKKRARASSSSSSSSTSSPRGGLSKKRAEAEARAAKKRQEIQALAEAETKAKAELDEAKKRYELAETEMRALQEAAEEATRLAKEAKARADQSKKVCTAAAAALRKIQDKQTKLTNPPVPVPVPVPNPVSAAVPIVTEEDAAELPAYGTTMLETAAEEDDIDDDHDDHDEDRNGPASKQPRFSAPEIDTNLLYLETINEEDIDSFL
jgi:chromosome segregation ATPase